MPLIAGEYLNARYREARGYAFKLTNQYYNDLLHDAYIIWFNKTGKNIFEQHRGVITKTIKNIWMSQEHKRTTWMYDRVIYLKTFVPITEDVQEIGYAPSSSDFLTDMFVAEDMGRIRQMLDNRSKQVFDLMIQGYNQAEIAEKLGTYRQMTQGEVRKIKKAVAGL